jgi:hypothetical protein
MIAALTVATAVVGVVLHSATARGADNSVTLPLKTVPGGK